MKHADQEACDHDTYIDPDPHGYSICMDWLSTPKLYGPLHHLST